MKILLTLLGRFLALLPRFVVMQMCRGIGWLVASFPSPRRRALYANIYRCFPNLSKDEIRSTALNSARGTIEMGLFDLASPYISERELKSRIHLSDFIKDELKKRESNPKALLLLIPHFCMAESITLLPIISETPLPKAGVFYRPFDNPSLEAWIRETRQKYGINLLSRRDGLMISIDYMRAKGCIAVLYDQNMNKAGVLSMFFDRICTTTEIGGLLAERTDCDVGIFYARRTGFWRANIEAEYLNAKSKNDVILKANDWLEKTLINDEGLRRDWLWLHKRWKIQQTPSERFKVSHKHDILPEYLAFKGYDSVPRKTDFLVRAPGTLAEILDFIPAFRALHASRYDGRFTIMANPKHAKFLRQLNIAEKTIETPADKKRLLELHDMYYTTEILFADSSKDDEQARTILADLKFAIKSTRKRRGIENLYTPTEDDMALPRHLLYEKFLVKFGMDKPLDFSPVKIATQRNEDLIAICVGGEEKMGLDKWKTVLKEIADFLPHSKFAFFSTNLSSPIAAELANIYADKIESAFNISQELAAASIKIAQCAAATGSDELLLKLANALGVPCVGNIANISLIYDAPRISIEPDPETCAPQTISSYSKNVATEITLLDQPSDPR